MKVSCVIRVWESACGSLVATLVGHTGLVRDLAFSTGDDLLLSAGWDQTVRDWTIDS